jgi:hypothetical protein
LHLTETRGESAVVVRLRKNRTWWSVVSVLVLVVVVGGWEIDFGKSRQFDEPPATEI